MANFKEGDKVVEKGTTKPIMTVGGNTLKPKGAFKYEEIPNMVTCIWEDEKGVHAREFNASLLELSS